MAWHWIYVPSIINFNRSLSVKKNLPNVSASLIAKAVVTAHALTRFSVHSMSMFTILVAHNRLLTFQMSNKRKNTWGNWRQWKLYEGGISKIKEQEPIQYLLQEPQYVPNLTKNFCGKSANTTPEILCQNVKNYGGGVKSCEVSVISCMAPCAFNKHLTHKLKCAMYWSAFRQDGHEAMCRKSKSLFDIGNIWQTGVK